MNQKNTVLVTTVEQLWKGLKWSTFGAFLILFIACSKYEDNTGITFKSVNKRLVDDWMLDEVISDSLPSSVWFIEENSADSIINDQDTIVHYDTVQILNGQDELITFDDYDGLRILRVRIMDTYKDYEVAIWLLSSDKKTIEVNFGRDQNGNPILVKTLEIKRLDNNYFWFLDEEGVEWRYHRHVVEI